MVEKGKRENINGHGECDFNYCRRRVRIAVSFAIPVSPELFAQFVARMLDCTVLNFQGFSDSCPYVMQNHTYNVTIFINFL